MRVISGSARGHQLKVPKGMTTRPMADKIKSAVFSMLTNLLAHLERDWGRVLDLYSGTGSIGIEALSRGASWADFVEVNAGVCRLISENLEHTHFADKSRVNNRPVQAFLNSPPAAPKAKGQRAAGGLHRRKGGSSAKRKAEREQNLLLPETPPPTPENPENNDAVSQFESQYDIIFLDPPYADPKIPETIKHVATSGLVKAGGLVVVGHTPRLELADSYGVADSEAQGEETVKSVVLNRLRYRRHGDSAFSVYIAGDPVAFGFGEDATANDEDSQHGDTEDTEF